MSFIHPLGLLGLIGIPVIIIIYILKNRYIEQIISTNYIWLLSERFLKRRNPFAKLAGLIALILQLILVAVISLSIAHPVFTLDGEAHNYTFILDGSGSMRITERDGERFELAKDEIRELIDGSTKGSKYSCILVTDRTTVVFENESDKDKALRLLDDLEPSDAVISLTDAVGIAQSYFNVDTSALTYLITDKTYDRADNVSVISVGTAVANSSLIDVRVDGTVNLSVRGSVLSHTSDAALTLGVFIDDSATPISTLELSLTAGVAVPFSIPLNTDNYYSVAVRILEEDALAADNEAVIYNTSGAEGHDALIVSEQPFFISAALRAVSALSITELRPDEYAGQSGFDLYVFDSYTPYSVPKDGAVWIINPVISTQGVGFSVQGKYVPEAAVEIEPSTSTNTQVRKLLTGLTGTPIHVTEYVKCGIYDPSFITLISHKGNPLVFAGANEWGNREVVFAFDLHESDLVGLTDWIALVSNFVEFSFPTVLERTDYTAGDVAYINVIAGCSSIVVTSPSGKVTSLAAVGTAAEITLSEAGIYKIECITGGNAKDYYVFSEFPESERVPLGTGGEISLLGEAGNNGIDGIYDNLTVLFILLAVVFLADWAVYCYEKYKLR
ncbi:MAG: VWA domain-containing protein [Clostridia bacterium]|nr:VWA domain-containing protein [Clostridia bacterium]